MITLGTIGLVANGKRKVTPVPSGLLKLVPKPVDKNITVVSSNADTLRDTVPLMLRKIKRTRWQTRKLARALKGSTIANTLRNDWNFIFNHIQYQEDQPGKEQVRSPRRLIYEGKGDCDCFSVALATLIANQGIKGKLRIAKYAASKNPKDWSHVYIVVPKDGNLQKKLTNRADYYVLDPVVHQFDYEEPPSEVKDFSLNTMELQSLDGLPSATGVNGLGSCNTGGKNKGSDLVRVSYLKQQDIVPTNRFLTDSNVPFTVRTLPDGSVRYDAVKANGETLTLPPVVGPQQRAEATQQLAQTTPSTPETTTEETGVPKSNWVWWMLGIAGGIVLLGEDKSKRKTETPTNGLGKVAKVKSARPKPRTIAI